MGSREEMRAGRNLTARQIRKNKEIGTGSLSHKPPSVLHESTTFQRNVFSVEEVIQGSSGTVTAENLFLRVRLS